jgi:Fur family iron response transcriptional regulator
MRDEIHATVGNKDQIGVSDVPGLPVPAELTGCPWRDVNERLRAAGLRPTKQRTALGWLLFGKGERHLTAEMLFNEAVQANMSVSLATVYNTVNQLSDLGVLRRVSVDGAKTYYDTNLRNHHHFYFEESHELVDVLNTEVRFEAIPEIPNGQEVVRIDMIIRLRRKT